MGVLDTFEIGRQGLNVHSKRIQVAAKNIANLDTPNYVRKIPVLNATEDISFAGLLNTMKEDVFGIGTIPFISGGVRFTGLVEDPTQGEKIYRKGRMTQVWVLWQLQEPCQTGRLKSVNRFEIKGLKLSPF